ncbi:MAG: hypothetical protein Q9M94_03435 [Candidatus Gracilibacteria bacterium]|nr:hypothetical protein [Candidatus Gracilibacteria bacterium]MDQ7022239.1 hypothetical protein [Candidatus Gracilibacteria bacterium]
MSFIFRENRNRLIVLSDDFVKHEKNNLNLEEKKVLLKNCNYLEKSSDKLKNIKSDEYFILLNYCNFTDNKLDYYDLQKEKERKQKILEKYINGK